MTGDNSGPVTSHQSSVTSLADVLPGYLWDARSGRYRSLGTGKFVARRHITDLLRSQIDSAEERLGELTTAFHEGKIAAALWMAQMRTELRRLALQNEALGAGGWDQLGPREYGAVGATLRDEYRRLQGTAEDVQAGRVSLPQALNRTAGYVGVLASLFWQTERENAQRTSTNTVLLERNVLATRTANCRGCLDETDRGWQHLGVISVPGTRDCRGNCRCRLERVEVEAGDVQNWLGTRR